MAQKLIKFITQEEFNKILKAEKKPSYKLAYALGFCSGMRISELIGFKGKSVRKNKKTGEVIEKETEVKALSPEQVNLKEHKIIIISGKGEKDRVTVTPPIMNESHLKLLPLKIKRRTLQDRFTKLSLKVLGKRLSFHTLRHGFGNYMVNEKNVPIPMVQQLMGHSRIDTTGVYTKANPKQAIERAWESF